MNTNTNHHDLPTTTATPAAGKPAVVPPPSAPSVFTLGLDVDLHYVVTAIQCDHGVIKPAHK